MEKIESFKCQLVSFDQIAQWTEEVARKVDQTGCRPTVIIGLTRGGWVPARLLCDHLRVKKLYAIKTEHWGVTASPDGKALLTQELNVSIKGEDVLIVDDITDTGESMRLAMSHLNGLGAKEAKSATLLHFTHSEFEPDFYAEKLPNDPWIWFIFPWNVHEDLRTLLPKTLYQPRTLEGIREAFKKQFQIDVPEVLIKETLQELAADKKIVQASGKWALR